MKDRKKIIHLIQALDNGGCENMLLRTLPRLADFNHVIITLKERGDLAYQFEENKIPIVNINQHSLLDIFSYIRLWREIKQQNPDLIVTYLFHADAIGRLFLQSLTNIRIVPFLRTTYNHKKYLVARFFEKTTKGLVKFYLANSESVKNFYVKNIGVKKDKIIVVPNGIDVSFYDSTEIKQDLKENFGIKEENLTIICVTNLSINKGHRYLLEAFELLYKNHKNIKLLLIGDGIEKDNLLQQIDGYESRCSIYFLGKRFDVQDLLKISDIFVSATFFEGMSNAIMEAMASSLAIVTTNIPENKELIVNNVTGLLVPTKNSVEIKNSLEKIIRDDNFRIELGKMAHKEILSKFEINITLDKLSHAINKLTCK